jgi:hypothetical protein
MFFTDTVEIIPTTKDQWGRITEDEGVSTPARVADSNQLIKDRNGNEVMPNMIILLPKTVTIKINYKIKVKTRQGVAYESPDKKWSLITIYHAGGLSPHHIEVFL